MEYFEFSINYENRLGGLLKTRKIEEDYHLIKAPFVFGKREFFIKRLFLGFF